MKLLIITQKVDKTDPILGFFHKWIDEFSKHFELVTVICLNKGSYSLPANVKVCSLGKENGVSRAGIILRFYSLIIQEKNNYDTVFIHMNPIYGALGGFVWKLMGKKVSMWYTHRNVDTKLKIAAKYVDLIFSASKESFNLPTSKVMITGHGIDVDRYIDVKRTKPADSSMIRIIHVGRITPIKDLVTLVESANILNRNWKRNFEVVCFGSAINDADNAYFSKIKDLLKKYDLGEKVFFPGSVKPDEIINEYARADISINLTPTGGLDKAVLESMAAGVPALSSNETFRDYFGNYTDILLFKEKNADDLAQKIINIIDKRNGEMIGSDLRKIVAEKSDVRKLINLLSEKMKNL